MKERNRAGFSAGKLDRVEPVLVGHPAAGLGAPGQPRRLDALVIEENIVDHRRHPADGQRLGMGTGSQILLGEGVARFQLAELPTRVERKPFEGGVERRQQQQAAGEQAQRNLPSS